MRIGSMAVVMVIAAVLGSSALSAGAQPVTPQIPGTVTQVDEMPARLHLDGAASARRLVYWTRTDEDVPALSSGALFIPAGTPPAGGWPVVAWNHGTVGIADNCAPSTTDLGGYQDDLTNLVRHGYAVAATDYIGLGTPGMHAYLDGPAEAHATIDMIRAAHAVDPSLAPRWAVAGHSQGGQATLFTAALVAEYAPELDYRAAVAYAPGASIAGQLELASTAGQPGIPDLVLPGAKAYLAYVLRGLKAARPQFDLDSYLTPLGKQIIADAERLCLTDMSNRMADVSVGQMLTRPLTVGDFDMLAHPLMDAPMTGYRRPILIAQGLVDTDVFAPSVWQLILELKNRGARDIELLSYPDADHDRVLIDAQPDTNAFLAAVFR
ncbi:lipase family protein [Nocardia sp. NBC_01499]|uniref:lipase family protein n=1 Tax=Nocardia sp. NBC_01499 TaxID=2903597 RepID=UPI003868C67E